MIKIFVHEISHLGESKYDSDRDLYYPCKTDIRIYCNKKEFDFSDIRYWKVVDSLKELIMSRQGEFEHYGYIGDFYENHYRERPEDHLAKIICDDLNKVAGGVYFEVFNLEPYKTVKHRLNWDRYYHYYAPKESECCYDITNVFLEAPSIYERYEMFLKQYALSYYSVSISKNPYYRRSVSPLSRELEIAKQITKLEIKLRKLDEELKKVQEICNAHNLRLEAFCKFIIPYIEKKIPFVNDVIDVYPKDFRVSVSFKEEDSSSYQSKFYPLNIALELKDKELMHKLIKHGAYKFSRGYFYDGKNEKKTPQKHTLECLLKLCDNEHYNLLKKNLKEHSEWNDELEAKFPNK